MVTGVASTVIVPGSGVGTTGALGTGALAYTGSTGVPQCGQNFMLSASLLPQFVQNIHITPLYTHRLYYTGVTCVSSSSIL